MQDLYKRLKFIEDLNQFMKTQKLVQQTKTQPTTTNRKVPIKEIPKHPIIDYY